MSTAHRLPYEPPAFVVLPDPLPADVLAELTATGLVPSVEQR